MSRFLVFTVLLAGLTAAAFSQPSGPAAGKADADKKPADKKPADKVVPPTAHALVEKLISTVDFPGYDDPKTVLGDVA